MNVCFGKGEYTHTHTHLVVKDNKSLYSHSGTPHLYIYRNCIQKRNAGIVPLVHIIQIIHIIHIIHIIQKRNRNAGMCVHIIYIRCIYIYTGYSRKRRFRPSQTPVKIVVREILEFFRSKIETLHTPFFLTLYK